MKIVTPPCSSDFRAKANEWHERFDGRIYIPEKLALILAGSLAAVVPTAILYLIAKGG